MIRPAVRMDFIALSTKLKPDQKKALLALVPEPSAVRTLTQLGDNKGKIAAAFLSHGNLIAVAGAALIHPNVASTFLYATADLKKVIVKLTRWTTRDLFPTLAKVGVHRVHSLGLADDETGIRWKEDCLGFEREAVLKGYGKGGEDYILHRLLLAPKKA